MIIRLLDQYKYQSAYPVMLFWLFLTLHFVGNNHIQFPYIYLCFIHIDLSLNNRSLLNIERSIEVKDTLFPMSSLLVRRRGKQNRFSSMREEAVKPSY